MGLNTVNGIGLLRRIGNGLASITERLSRLTYCAVCQEENTLPEQTHTINKMI